MLCYSSFFAFQGTKAQEEVKHQIILSVENESNDTVRRKKADCLAELARKLFGM